jgi:putative NIF3 family GTP cyclohydrolase 1 type 2
MKLTKSKLKQIIKEAIEQEIQTDEVHLPFDPKLENFRDAMEDLAMAVAYHYRERGAHPEKNRELILDVIQSAVDNFREGSPGWDIDDVLEEVYDEEIDADLEQKSREDEDEHGLEEKMKTSPTGREEEPCKGRGCVTKQRKEIEKYAHRIDKKLKSGDIDKTYIDKKTGKRKKTNKYALATAAAKDPGSMRGKDFARKIPKDVNPKTGAKKKKKD